MKIFCRFNLNALLAVLFLFNFSYALQPVQEGTVLHEFTRGYFLRGSIRPEPLSGGNDIVSWQIATERFLPPFQGKVLKDNFIEDPAELIWESTEANNEGVFNGEIRRSWLFTSYKSEEEKVVLLEASGHTRVLINGMPREGDHFDFDHTLIPFVLRKGDNQFLFSPGRFGRVSARLLNPTQPVMFSMRDMTLPAIIRGERDNKWGAIRVINSGDKPLTGFTITCRLQTGESVTIAMDNVIPLTTRKVKFQVPAPRRFTRADTLMATLSLRDALGNEIHRVSIGISQQDVTRHHERTFISKIDGSVQYFSVAPSLSTKAGQAMVLSLHGAGVEARGQTRAYTQKDWAHIVAPTNRRPFGFNWEEWGRLDALEVLEIARKKYPSDPLRTYVTGHSMGGYGSWFMGVTYPDKFAAIGPAAGVGHRRVDADSALKAIPHFEMVYRGAKAGRTLYLTENLKPIGIYILHGDADVIVPVEHARFMRERIGRFHTNFAYHEQIGASHWDGNHAMDWPPLFDFLRQNTLPHVNQVRNINFRTASPGVSSTNHWVRVNQQQRLYEISAVELQRTNDTIAGTLQNVQNITFLLSKLDFKSNPVIQINGQTFSAEKGKDVTLEFYNGNWRKQETFNYSEKHPVRYGGFKLAFTNNMVFVYATGGTPDENEWYKNKARFDAETWLYRANGSVDIVADHDFSPGQFEGRNVILYGNASNNKAWDALLANAPVRVENGQIRFGRYELYGNDLGAYFIFPKPGCNFTSVGVIAGTGNKGMRALWPNDYFSAVTGYPDLMIFGADWLRDGIKGIKVSGFFGNDWSVENGDFNISY